MTRATETARVPPLEVCQRGLRAVVPTRDLARQVYDVFDALTQGTSVAVVAITGVPRTGSHLHLVCI